jgi:uncharacterized membrane protein YgaE (UPF0421/DUF939 family)
MAEVLATSTANFRLAIKTALAGCLAMYFADLMRLPQSYWAAISAMIVMQTNLGAAVKQSWIRFAATAVGAAISIPFAAYFPQNLFVFGVAVFLTVVLCTVLHLEDGLRLAAVTIAIILLVPHTGRPWVPALNRFLEVSFGIFVALLVAEFVWPSSALENLRTGLAAAFLHLEAFFSALLQRYHGQNSESVAEVRAKLANLRRQIAEFHAHCEYEPARWSANRSTLVKLMEHEDRLSRAVEALDIACDGPSGVEDDSQWQPELSALCGGISAALKQIAEAILTRKLSTAEFDFPAAIQALDAKAGAARKSETPMKIRLDDFLRSHTFLFGVEALARELAAAQITARDLVPASSVPSAVK